MIMFGGGVYRRGLPNLYDGTLESFGNLAERLRELKELEIGEHAVNKKWRLVLSYIWSTSRKPSLYCGSSIAHSTSMPTLPVMKMKRLTMGAEISMEKENESSHKQEDRRISKIKCLLAGRRGRRLFAWRLRSLILRVCQLEGRVMETMTLLIKKARPASYFQEKKENHHIQSLDHHHNVSGAFGGGMKGSGNDTTSRKKGKGIAGSLILCHQVMERVIKMIKWKLRAKLLSVLLILWLGLKHECQ
ncbi:hypothetical protein Pfo_025081 [Paulownia fortunei]|nr:hypothetical protein Pfo_025081 [Paulownia fortunei]